MSSIYCVVRLPPKGRFPSITEYLTPFTPSTSPSPLPSGDPQSAVHVHVQVHSSVAASMLSAVRPSPPSVPEPVLCEVKVRPPSSQPLARGVE